MLTAQYTFPTGAGTGLVVLYFYVSEYDAAGTLYTQGRLSIEGPFTAGSAVTATGPVDASVVSCVLTNAAGR